jgi:hypothetical protein
MTASRRRGPFERLARAMAVYLVLAASMGSTPASAADLPATYCALDRAPILDWLRLAKGDDCPFDEDGNGLDDSVETALARCFVPEIIFDSRENALGPDEPHVVFSADPIAPRVIRLHFVVLFARDGGYALGTEFPCLRDEHNGDAEAITVDVVWLERDRRWFGAPLTLHTSGPDGIEQRTALSSIEDNGLSGTHPLIYATAGKHHWLHQTASLTYGCDCGPIGRCGSVRDRVDGNGPRIVPTSLRHAPRFVLREGPAGATNDASARARVRPLVPLDASGREFRNACTHRTRGVLALAERSLGSNDLGDLGYPGERVFGACFRGGLGGPCFSTVSVGEALAWDNPPAAANGPSEIGARKLIASLLGIAGRAPLGDSGKVKAFGRARSRLDGVPSAVFGWSQPLEAIE